MRYILPFLLVLAVGGVVGVIVYQSRAEVEGVSEQQEVKVNLVDEWRKMKDGSQTTIYIRGVPLVVEVVNTPASLAQGLSDREELPNDGMLFVFNEARRQQFWMKNMNFPLDMVWVRGTRVVGVTEGAEVPPEAERESPSTFYYSPELANVVIELAEGRAKELGITKGDEIGKLP